MKRCALIMTLLLLVAACAPEPTPSPTPTPTVTPSPTSSVNPRVEIAVSRRGVPLDQTVIVTGKVYDIGLTIHTLTIEDEGSGAVGEMVIRYDGHIERVDDGSAILEIVSAEAGMYDVAFTLRGRAVGRANVSIWSSGEIHEGYPGPAYWGGATSETITLAVVRPVSP